MQFLHCTSNILKSWAISEVEYFLSFSLSLSLSLSPSLCLKDHFYNVPGRLISAFLLFFYITFFYQPFL